MEFKDIVRHNFEFYYPHMLQRVKVTLDILKRIYLCNYQHNLTYLEGSKVHIFLFHFMHNNPMDIFKHIIDSIDLHIYLAEMDIFRRICL